MSNKALCIFHRGCMDGFSSAYVVGLFLGFDRVEFLQIDYDEPVPDLTDRNVYIVDFSFKPKDLLPVLDTAKSVVMLDHHKSAIKHWDGIAADESDSLINKKLLFVRDIKQSGVGITWNFFFADKPMPSLLAVCQDYDLWQFKLPFSREIVTALYAKNMIDTNQFARFHELVIAKDHSDLVSAGHVVLEYQEGVVRGIIARCAKMVKVLGYVVPVCPIPRGLHSLAGNILCAEHPFSITYEDQLDKGIRMFSLRSHPTDGLDVSEICEKLGAADQDGSGGGNEHAAGFVVNFSTLVEVTSDHFMFFNNLTDTVSQNNVVNTFNEFEQNRRREISEYVRNTCC